MAAERRRFDVMCGILFALSKQRWDEQNAFTDEDMEAMRDVLEARGPDAQGVVRRHADGHELCFWATLLQLRGKDSVAVPLESETGSLLAFNGQLFGGIDVKPDENDARRLLQELERTESDQVPQVLSRLRGPWSLVYWNKGNSIVWIARDVLGRRSLLIHRPDEKDPRLILTSVMPRKGDEHCAPAPSAEAFWEELPTGIYSLNVRTRHTQDFCVDPLVRFPWVSAELERLEKWVRIDSAGTNPLPGVGEEDKDVRPFMDALLQKLRGAVRQRVSHVRPTQCQLDKAMSEGALPPALVAVMFSGGVDSALLALLAHEAIAPHSPIDLLNVCFADGKSPDRLSAHDALEELMSVAPTREWRLFEVNSSLSQVDRSRTRLMQLLAPSNTHMDLNIGAALWIAASGYGRVCTGKGGRLTFSEGNHCSLARVMLVGHGIDEQCAGYGRHRTRFRNGGWSGLEQELRLDMARLWKRNLGRDDRVLSDRGKEARHPYLDECVVGQLLDTPLWMVADLRQPPGVGDKRLLRACAHHLGLEACSRRTKRAIQFGTRLAKQSNARDYGSNRAANLAKAGSASVSHVDAV